MGSMWRVFSHRTEAMRLRRVWRSGAIFAVGAIFFAVLFVLLHPPSVNAETSAVTWPIIRLELLVDALDAPVGLVDARDGTNRLFVIERGGTVRIVKNGVISEQPFLDVSDRVLTSCSECGLLGLAFPPDFAEGGYFFINYTSNTNRIGPDPNDPDDPDGIGDTVIARIHLSADPNVADAASEETVMEINQPADNHNGGHMVFGPDDYLYIGMGDGGGGDDEYKNAQDSQSLLGKILRVEVGKSGTYTVPPDNPFIDTPNYRDEIWALGLRNPWRFHFDPTTWDLYVADVGQNKYEEVNVVAAEALDNGGMNFGWPIFEGNECYLPLKDANPANDDECERTDLTQPAATYTHAQNNCSITGGYVYESPMLHQTPVYLYGDFCSGNVWALQNDAGEWVSEQVNDLPFMITTFGQDETGNVYVVNYEGELYQLIGPANLYLPTLQKPN